jgi:hypothetical protein
MLNCNALWYSTLGPPLVLGLGLAPPGVTAAVVHTKCEVSIWILSVHFAPISLKASLAFSNNTGSWTLPKQTQIPEVSCIVCVRTRMRLEGYVPAVVRRISWNLYSVLISMPECFVVVFVITEGTAERRSPFLYMSKDLIFAVASLMGSHSRVTDVCVTFRTCPEIGKQ